MSLSRAGYVLLESLMAISVLSVSLVIVHRDMQQAIQVRGMGRDATEVRFLIEKLMADIALQVQLPECERKGEFDGELSRYSWRWKVSRYVMPKPPMPPHLNAQEVQQFRLASPHLMKAEVWVKWTRNGTEREEKAETLFSPQKLFVPAETVP